MELRAPSPDFRYVGLCTESPGSSAASAALSVAFFAGAGAIAALAPGGSVRGTTFVVASCAALAAASRPLLRRARAFVRARSAAVATDAGPSVAVVPWGLLVESSTGRRAVRWAAVKNVEMDVVHGRDQLTPVTRYSVVRIDVDAGGFVGYASGAAPLERLLVHLRAYAGEQSCAIALDLDGDRSLTRPFEPQCETLFSAVRSYLGSGDAHDRLSLPGGSYRVASAGGASPDGVRMLHEVLAGRDCEPSDRRPFAAAIAAELHAVELVDDLVALVASPHPLVASVAKAAALRLGAGVARVGTLDEIAPFLGDDDLAALASWQLAG